MRIEKHVVNTSLAMILISFLILGSILRNHNRPPVLMVAR